MEVVGGVSAVVGITDILFRTCLAGYKAFRDAQNVGKDFKNFILKLELSRQNLLDWNDEVQRSGKKLHELVEPTSLRYQLILQALALIAETFTEFDRLKRDYGIARVGEVAEARGDARSERPPMTENSGPPPPYKMYVRAPAGEGGTAQELKGMIRGLFKSYRASHSPSYPVNTPGSTKDILAWLPGLGEDPLDDTAPDLDTMIQDMKLKSALYQEMVPTLQRYKWALTDSKKSDRLVEELEVYVGYLGQLTRLPLKLVILPATVQSPPPFDEFRVPRQLPYPRLDNFCGQEDILKRLEDLLLLGPSVANTKSTKKRAVVLKGMGGMGKSQIALEYLFRHPNDYSAVIWVDATDGSTVCDSGRQMLQMLIRHYSTKYHGPGDHFADVATDLGIPGQIMRGNVLVEEISKAPWPPLKRWLAREGNTRWCLVVDGLNTPEDEKWMNELLPSCDHGHIIVTSRFPVTQFANRIDVGGMDPESSMKILLAGSIETSSVEDKEAAQSVAEELGYLPLALSLAAAYVVQRSLDFIEYRTRLMRNMSRFLRETILGHPRALASCWQLSVQELLRSNGRNSIDLLRLCSFLSPEGVSKELLVRGLGSLEWCRNAEEDLEDAMDNLVMYALVIQKSSNISNDPVNPQNSKSNMVYWIHPLVRRWAQEISCDGQSAILETDPTQLQRLRTRGYLEAISLVGGSLRTRYDNRGEAEWLFERRNMTHISLCLEKYIPECDLATDEAAAVAKVSLALVNFSGLQYYWNEFITSTALVREAIGLYKKLVSLHPRPGLEAELLMAMQHLSHIYVTRMFSVSNGLLDETLSRQSEILTPDDPHLLWTESLKARELYLEEKVDEALDRYHRCLDKMEKVLNEGDPVYMATVYSLAWVYKSKGDLEQASRLFDQSTELYLKYRGPNHQDTHVVLAYIALARHRSRDHQGELGCLRIVAEGSEATYGLANEQTLHALRELKNWYENHGKEDGEEAEIITKKISEGLKLQERAIRSH